MSNWITICTSSLLLSFFPFGQTGALYRTDKALSKGELAHHRVLRCYTPENSALVFPCVNVVIHDNSGRTWVGTDRGVNLIDEVHNQFLTFTSKSGELIENRVSMIGQSKDNKLWLAGRSRGDAGPGLSCFDGRSWSWVDLSRESLTIPHQYVSTAPVEAIFRGKDDRLWFVVDDTLIAYDGKNWKRYHHLSKLARSRVPITVFSGLEDSAGIIWLGGFGIMSLEPRTSLCKTYNPMKPLLESAEYRDNWQRITEALIINCVYEDRKKRLWFGSADGRVYVYDRQSDFWTTYNLREHLAAFTKGATSYSPSSGDQKLSLSIESEVNCIYQDVSGQVLVGTNQGLAVFRENDEGWTQFRSNTSDLIGDMVRTINEDRIGRIWLGSDRGIMVLEP